MHMTTAHSAGAAASAARARLTALRWQLYYAGWQPGPARVQPDGPVFVSVTDFHVEALRWAPAAWRTGLRLRRSWPRLEGAVGIWLWAEPLKLRSGAVSVWLDQRDLVRFLTSPVHRAIVRDYRPRMSGTSIGWTAARYDRTAIWEQAIHAITESATLGPAAAEIGPVARAHEL